MLAFYLAAPEVENDRRALNVLLGMRKARKEGRWMGPTPVGYINKTSEDGKKYIKIKEPEASIIKSAFEKVAEGQLNVDQIAKEVIKKGIKCCSANFWYLLRNPVYCGKIFLSAYKDEQKRYVQGIHQPIISEALFYEVQDCLDGKKKTYKTKVEVNNTFQLRGYLICPKCGKVLTGSASKGRRIKYNYYHCDSTCGARFRAENANDLFVKELKKFIPRPGMVEVYKLLLLEEYRQLTKDQRLDIKFIKDALEKVNTALFNARKLLLSGDIEPSEYREIKSEYESKIIQLESKLIAVKADCTNIEPLINKGVDSLSNLHVVYENADNKTKRDIIGSIFPEKLTFDGFHYRTTRLNEAVELIYKLGEGFGENKNGQHQEKIVLSKDVTWIGFEPMTLSLEG